MKPEVFLKQLFEHLDIEAISFSVEELEEEVIIKIKLDETAAGLVIGSRARGADAIQHLVRVIFGKQYDQKRVFIDINDYREQRKEKIESLIKLVVEAVVKTQQPSMISQFLSPSERFYVHKTLGDDKQYSNLESYSVGEGVGRRVVIQLKQPVVGQKEKTTA